MPTISVGRDLLFEALGRTYTQDEFEELCFEFGIELDDVTTEKAIIRKEKHLKEEEEIGGDEEVIYKIDIPANRYDLLCLEGLVQSLRIFCGVDSVPKYTLADISKELMLKMHVKPETSVIRPYVVCAVLRGITFNEARYNSFIDLQDKLHQNICRRRTLVAIGTHDLDTVEGPFTYEALAPSEIEFKPLKQVETFRADKLMEFYKSDLKLKKYLHIIEDSPVFPVIYDRNRTVLSLPPIINGAHSAISLKTKNVFIECTATDLTKAKIVLNTMVTMFSVYCQRKFEVEPVEVIYSDGKSNICPELSPYHMEVSLAYINGIAGVSLEANKVAGLLNKMQLHAQQSVSVDNECIFTDVAIAYGFNEIPKRKPASLKPLPLNQFSDLIRTEIALTGYTEVLTWILCSYKENFPMLNRKDDKSTAVIIGNPRSADFEVVRSSLMAGILKTVAHNKDHPKPIKIFEVGDVTVLDELKDVGATNHRQLAALYCGATSGFEEPEFLSGRQANLIYKGKRIGTFGIVLENFDIPDPCSFVELNMESLLL
ncbi:B3/B4 tRNA-binding domain-containing protein [Cynara cardunculus var. scolymus]|uniref:phenylalanine--tRNA ligase n=1 Tax=Cynara cardunculus var. scolymus TaxID=59895 RepID=A0A124SE17_CYNCS|nr:B3/B4 tRNA-binding domain-containing protein [Cynara cardunculus var. scolymus]